MRERRTCAYAMSQAGRRKWQTTLRRCRKHGASGVWSRLSLRQAAAAASTNAGPGVAEPDCASWANPAPAWNGAISRNGPAASSQTRRLFQGKRRPSAPRQKAGVPGRGRLHRENRAGIVRLSASAQIRCGDRSICPGTVRVGANPLGEVAKKLERREAGTPSAMQCSLS